MRNDGRSGRRRGISERKDGYEFSFKNTLYIAGTILALGIIAFFVTVMVYNNNLEKIYSDLETKEIGEVTINENEEEKTEEASANLGKTIEELEENKKTSEEVKTNTEEDKKEEQNTKDTQSTTQAKQETKNTVKQENQTEVKKEESTNETKQEEEETTKEPTFAYPVEGKIAKEYAKDNLVYSETLKEWVTHTAVDIAADKTTVVKAAEAGRVTAIKNDPRYGTTVIIEHSNGYETRYANLLTAEFVNIGEEVTKGQTVGTVGNTGAFEVLDDYHLHFEILKDGEYQDPMLYLK